ncbi:hypothetical protein ATCV1_z320L [Acanthocystis turfacea chlorella virus 1]|uniref:Uncharacterized protein z320L n=1 Tax=Chlorovirus heliozoae TaxID=322019 RepID=A7K8T0_9PHYC|nr:hypothetical protein ATCV1_z320L [Acanthocystis turfacea chlorella virus 1]ABT16454.1 hypothetical protein ATCV1_z320L [Acanthocystis turfacea chlorella virus 1]
MCNLREEIISARVRVHELLWRRAHKGTWGTFRNSDDLLGRCHRGWRHALLHLRTAAGDWEARRLVDDVLELCDCGSVGLYIRHWRGIRRGGACDKVHRTKGLSGAH